MPPLGWSVCSRQIQRSSWYSLSSTVFKPIWRIWISICFSGSWLRWKCADSSVLSGLFRQSYLCFENLSWSLSPVCPTYNSLHFLHRTAYIRFRELQLPKSRFFCSVFFTFGFEITRFFYKHHLYKHRQPRIWTKIKHHLSTSLSLTSLKHTNFVIRILSIFQILVCSRIQIFINEMYCEFRVILHFKISISCFWKLPQIYSMSIK